jgi:threonine dehydrogenase-like Zn-dependent dehydrogenase
MKHTLFCPACGDKFNREEGRYSHCTSLSADLLVCSNHSDYLTMDEEQLVMNVMDEDMADLKEREE